MSATLPYDTLEIDDSDVYPDEKPYRFQRLKDTLQRPICKALLILIIVILLLLVSIGTSIGIGYSIGKAVNQVEPCQCDCSYSVSSVEAETETETEEAGFYSIDDFDTAPFPDLPNPFDPLQIEPIDDKPWPANITYHPLRTAKHSPEFVFRYIDDYDIDRNDITQRGLLESNEYQIRLDNDRFIDKMQGVQELQEIIGQFLGPHISYIEEPVESYWYELQYEKHGCSGDYSELRVRNYITGKHAGTASSSVNRDVKSKEELVATMMYPNADFLDDFEMKMEQG